MSKKTPRKRGKPFAKGADARRGRGPKPGTGGRPPNEFKDHMQALASGADVDAYLRKCLAGDFGPKFFLSALAYATDRGYGKAPQSVDVTAYDFNPDDFSDEGLDRVADGEDPMHVLATGGRADRAA